MFVPSCIHSILSEQSINYHTESFMSYVEIINQFATECLSCAQAEDTMAPLPRLHHKMHSQSNLIVNFILTNESLMVVLQKLINNSHHYYQDEL